MFALRDPSELKFSEECDHSYDLVCHDYERLYHLESLMNTPAKRTCKEPVKMYGLPRRIVSNISL